MKAIDVFYIIGAMYAFFTVLMLVGCMLTGAGLLAFKVGTVAFILSGSVVVYAFHRFQGE